LNQFGSLRKNLMSSRVFRSRAKFFLPSGPHFLGGRASGCWRTAGAISLCDILILAFLSALCTVNVRKMQYNNPVAEGGQRGG
jgi:hypothetical protein